MGERGAASELPRPRRHEGLDDELAKCNDGGVLKGLAEEHWETHNASRSLPASLTEGIFSALGRTWEPNLPVKACAVPLSPVHVFYGGAHLYRADSPAKLGALARGAMTTWGSVDSEFAAAVGMRAESHAELAPELARRVREKLERAPVEKLCIDFEDGYGPRPDLEEDAEAIRTAEELARSVMAGSRDPIVGIRIKSFTPASVKRAIRTLDLFVTNLARCTGGAIPASFTVTLPKVSHSAEVKALVDILAALETALGLKPQSLGIELMIETPHALVSSDGRFVLRSLVEAAKGRAVAVHLGAYDLLAALGVTAGDQRLEHPACDFARVVMQTSLADTGIDIYDGATTVLPLAAHRSASGLSYHQRAANVAVVQNAWRLHANAVRHALSLGIYQGWDLHPAQLPARYGALYTFFLTERRAMTARLRAFVAKATQATLSGQVFDDAATGQGLLNFFIRGAFCGALSDEDVRATGLSVDELNARSFASIAAARREP